MWLPRQGTSPPEGRPGLRAGAPPASWAWRHRPVGRGLMTAAVALLAGLALMLDAAAPAAGGALLAWHALSTAALAGFGLWALWTPELPRKTGLRLARGVGALMLGAFALAGQGAWLADAGRFGTTLVPVMAAASALFFVGLRWARREIDW
jgi:hypothetical protein